MPGFLDAELNEAERGLARHLACAKIAAYTDGSTEIMQERIGAGLMASYGPPL